MKKLQLSLLILILFMFSGCATYNAKVHKNVKFNKELTTIYFNAENFNDDLDIGGYIYELLEGKGYTVSYDKVKKALRQKTSSGSGFFINSSGEILTNYHVVSDNNKVKVRTLSGDTFYAEIIANDISNDVALLKPIDKYKPKKWLSISSFKRQKIGDKIFVVGYPLSNILGVHPRITDGIISSSVGLRGNSTNFQISAPIQPGNSGGPIVNEKFEAIGIASTKLSDLYSIKKTGQISQNVNFGVKIDYASMLISKKSKKKTLKDVNSVVESTVFILANPDNASSKLAKHKRIGVKLRYSSYFDLFHYSLRSLQISFHDIDTEEIVAFGTFRGDSPYSYKEITEKVLEGMLDKLH